MNVVALIVIYNHQYNENIEIIERIYRGRFSHIYHLVPFYKGEEKNVIAVYENSFYFQGYVAQALKSFFDKRFSHYIFVADDLILNPELNESNYELHFGLDSETSFLTEFIPLHKTKTYWPRVTEAVDWRVVVRGVEATKQLPAYDDAVKKFNSHGLTVEPVTGEQYYAPHALRQTLNKALRGDFGDLISTIYKKNTRSSFMLKFPLVGGYSDIFVVDSSAIHDFCHYCGVFAATNLFVELAIPTSLVLASKKITTENNIRLKGKALWLSRDYEILDQYKLKLKDLIAHFPRDLLYLHPIKLSKWSTQL